MSSHHSSNFRVLPKMATPTVNRKNLWMEATIKNRITSIWDQARTDSTRKPTARCTTMSSTRKVSDQNRSIPSRLLSESDRSPTISTRRNTTSVRTRSIWIRLRLILMLRGDLTGNLSFIFPCLNEWMNDWIYFFSLLI